MEKKEDRMGAPELTEEEIERIGLYVKKHIGTWIDQGNILPFTRETLLTERIVRVEEGIKHQGELLEKILHQMDARFEQVEKRFEQVDKRFEQVDKRFEEMLHYMDKKFDAVDVRFETMQHSMDKRFEQVDKRFSQLQWTMGLGFTLLAALMGLFNFY